MNVTVTLDTNDTNDRAALARLFDLPTTTTTVVSDAPVAVLQAPAPAPKAAAKPKPQPKVETPPPAPEEPAEDLLGGDETDYVALRKAAVDAATVLVSGGGSAKVREVLSGLGVKRVSELADGQLEEFIAAVA